MPFAERSELPYEVDLLKSIPPLPLKHMVFREVHIFIFLLERDVRRTLKDFGNVVINISPHVRLAKCPQVLASANKCYQGVIHHFAKR